MILLVGFLILQSALWLPKYWYLIWAVAVLIAVIHHRRKTIVKNGYEWFNSLSRVSIIVTIIMLVCGLMLLMPNLYKYRDALRYAEHYKGCVGEAWEWIDKNTGGNRIAYTGTNKSYPLFRPDISNYVTYIRTGLNADQINPKDKSYYTRWVYKMLAADIDYLFVCRMDRRTYTDAGIPYPVEKYWADMQPELFQPMFVNNYVTIYKVSKPAIPTPKLISWDLD